MLKEQRECFPALTDQAIHLKLYFSDTFLEVIVIIDTILYTSVKNGCVSATRGLMRKDDSPDINIKLQRHL